MELARAVEPRGPLSQHLLSHLARAPHPFDSPAPDDDALTGDDLHLALYLCYELHYRGLEGIDDRWEWEPSIITFRRSLEECFERTLLDVVPTPPLAGDMAETLQAVIDSDTGPSVADYMQSRATLNEFKEFVIHRSAYHLKEADPHSWAIPRLEGRAKAALVDIQSDEYGSGEHRRMHSRLFADLMDGLGLESAYGAYLSVVPGVTLASVNLMSLFGLNRRWRGAVVGHLAVFEMTSSVPNRKYANGLRRLGLHGCTDFFDEHVEADAVHAMIAAHDMAGALAQDEPGIARDIAFGANALITLDAAFARHVLAAWASGRSTLCRQGAMANPPA